jgi:hypothetical protein
MPIVDTGSLNVIERLPGWRGRYFHTATMTFAHYDFERDAVIHEHFHPAEEVYEVLEGESRSRSTASPTWRGRASWPSCRPTSATPSGRSPAGG